MSAPDTLHARLRAAVEERLAVARAAGGAPWEATVPGMVHVSAAAIRDDKLRFGHLGYVASVEREHDRAHIAANDPAAVIARCEALLRVVERHTPIEVRDYETDDATALACDHCELTSHDGDPLYRGWPCPDIRDLAAGEGIEVGDG